MKDFIGNRKLKTCLAWIPALVLALGVLSFAPPDLDAKRCTYRKYQRVTVTWKGGWYKARIIKVKRNCSKYKVHYKNFSKSWDEWVRPGRIRR